MFRTLRRETGIKEDQLFQSHPWGRHIKEKISSVLTLPAQVRQRYAHTAPSNERNHIMIAGTWSKDTKCRRNLSISLKHQTTAWLSQREKNYDNDDNNDKYTNTIEEITYYVYPKRKKEAAVLHLHKLLITQNQFELFSSTCKVCSPNLFSYLLEGWGYYLL